MFAPAVGLVRIASIVALFSLGGQSGTGLTSSADKAFTPAPGALGYDVGYQSCSSSLPTGGSFGVVGVTAGQPFHPSGCLSAEYAWAGALEDRPQFYVNLANPGHKSAHWAKGGPKPCRKQPKYDPGCAYDYGYQSAAAAWSYVTAIGSNGAGRWWLDVETDNSWGYTRAGVAANLADIRGALHYLRHRSHTAVGIYTETTWWDAVTQGSTSFANVPVWGGGAGTKRQARHNCTPHSVTGGPALLAQWIDGGVDHDLAC